MDENWFELYERYINARHQTGSMYLQIKNNFSSFHIQTG